jgi:pimeloyl-ACP methyl ester carboxylesterase
MATMGSVRTASQQQETPVALACRDLGGSGEPPLVILHGMLGSSRNWQTAGRDLALHRKVLAVDLRNHGLSPHAGSMTYEGMVADIVAWMDARGLASAEFLGHSMGGKVAMLLACRHPGRVGGLVVVDIAPKDYRWRARADEFAAMNELNLDDLKSRAEAEMRLEGRVPDWAMRKFLATNLERAPGGRWRWQVNLPVLTAALPQLERNPLGPLDRYGGRTAFIVGGRSSYVTAADHAAMRDHFPAATIQTLSGSGHNPHIEDRPALVAAVLSAIGLGRP